MATSCNPFMGEKTYDDGFFISSEPFYSYGRRWWRCDPWCKPKKGDWVGFWIALKKELSSDELDSIVNKIFDVEDEFSDTIHVESVEYSHKLPDIKFLVAFKKDSPYSLHDWMFDHFCEAFNNECELDYENREYVDWINYMGADEDWAIWESKFRYKDGTTKISFSSGNLNSDDYVLLSIKNYGRVSDNVLIIVRDWKDRSPRIVDCIEVTVEPNGEWSNVLSLNVRESIDFWMISVYKYPSEPCSYYFAEWPTSPNELIIGESPPPPSEEEPECVFVDKVSEVYLVVKQTGEMFYPGTELTVFHGTTLLCCGLIKNEGADGTCGMFIYDRNSGMYLDGVTKFLKSGDMWLASVELTPSPGEYVLEFHAVHEVGGELVVDDKV